MPHAAVRRGQQEAYAVVLGVTLRALRLKHNLQQGQLARRVGVTQSMLSRAERGQASLTLYQLRCLALAFPITPLALCERVEQVFTQAEHIAAATTGKETACWDALLDKSGPEGVYAVALLAQEKGLAPTDHTPQDNQR